MLLIVSSHSVLFHFVHPTDAANTVSSPPIMPFTDFYNITLEHIDFMEEYRTWQNYGYSSRSDICLVLFFWQIWGLYYYRGASRQLLLFRCLTVIVEVLKGVNGETELHTEEVIAE